MFQKFSFIIIFFVNINAFAYDLTGENYSHFSGFNLNESSLNDVQKEWGPAKIIIDGDASTASHRINYYFEKDNYYITFNSDEMGGGKIITSFLMCAGIPQEAFVSKSELILSQNDFAGLRIGMSINEIMLSFPKNTLLKKDKMLIALTKKRLMTEREKLYFSKQKIDILRYKYFNISTNIICYFFKERLRKIIITTSESDIPSE